ncbi:ABC transporter ATP-binding protein [Aestuariimicrobium soli]|uniref:ABC transporter ATP-binding protein n=1 Tax=Aestuariimicrobium soli TaxID=2035834 RepID=UPI003EC0958C
MTTTIHKPGRAEAATTDALLRVDDLTVQFGRGDGHVKAVEEVSLTLERGELCALVGESGCGKSTLAYALMGIVPPPGEVVRGTIQFQGQPITSMSRNQLNRLRGAEMSMVFQGAMNAFNPVLTIGAQVDHILEAHPEVFATKQAGRDYFRELLSLVQLQPDRIWKSFESQLSGGMKQRVAIAVALLLKPSLLILDEPTTALDVLNQRMVIEILKDLHRDLGLTIIFVTHDLAVVAELATKVAVMYAGRLVEVGEVESIFAGEFRHPYVQALIGAIPSVLEAGLTVKPIGGQVPNLAKLPPGCRFAPRCALAEDHCREVEPTLTVRGDHAVACHVVSRETATSHHTTQEGQ